MFSVHWVQHPVGHGGFHTGVARIGGRELSWVYDCGSRATQGLETLLKCWSETRCDPVDWLFISHFDADHVSGLQTLLHPARVRQVMLPYVNDDEMVVSLLHAIVRDRLDRPMTELFADPTGFFRARGVERVVYVGPGGEGGGEAATFEPDGPRRDGDWIVDMKPGGLKPLGSRRGAHDGEVPANGVVLPDAELWPGGGEMIVEYSGVGIRFVPYRAPIAPSAAGGMLHRLATLLGMPASGTPPIGLGAMALAAAKLAMTEAGRQSLVALHKAHVGSSNRASMSLLTIPVASPIYQTYWSVQGGHRWEDGSGQPGWLNTGDAELLASADLNDWEARYRPYLKDVHVLSLPHHGSDYNSNSSLYRLAPDAILTAQVKHLAVNHPGPSTKVAAGRRLVRVTGRADTSVDMHFEAV